MKNKCTAVEEVLECRLEDDLCRRLFNDAYGFILYNDTASFLELLDYRMNLKELQTSCAEDYLVFKYLLRLMLQRHPKKLLMLLPVSVNKTTKMRINSKTDATWGSQTGKTA